MPDNSKIADRLRELAEDKDLPTFKGYEMREMLREDDGAAVYVDGDGDVWVEDRNDDGAVCLTSPRERAIRGEWD